MNEIQEVKALPDFSLVVITLSRAFNLKVTTLRDRNYWVVGLRRMCGFSPSDDLTWPMSAGELPPAAVVKTRMHVDRNPDDSEHSDADDASPKRRSKGKIRDHAPLAPGVGLIQVFKDTLEHSL